MENFIIFNNNDKTLEWYCPSNIKESGYFKIGELFLNFLEIDFSQYEEKRLKLIEMIKSNTSGEDNEKVIRTLILELLSEDEPYHLYMDNSMSFIHNYNNDVLIHEKMNFLKIQNFYKKAIEFCLNVDCNEILEGLSYTERFYIFINTEEGEDLQLQNFTGGFVSFPNADKLTDTFYTIDGENLNQKKLTKEMAQKVKNHNPIIKECYSYSDVETACYLEFMKMITLNIGVKRCGNCGHYFALTDNYNTEYCDRIPEGETKTCKEIGAIRKYSKKLNNNPILKAYNKAYKTHYARIKYKKITKSEFSEWCIHAKAMLKKAKNDDISLEEFEQWLKK